MCIKADRDIIIPGMIGTLIATKKDNNNMVAVIWDTLTHGHELDSLPKAKCPKGRGWWVCQYDLIVLNLSKFEPGDLLVNITTGGLGILHKILEDPYFKIEVTSNTDEPNLSIRDKTNWSILEKGFDNMMCYSYYKEK